MTSKPDASLRHDIVNAAIQWQRARTACCTGDLAKTKVDWSVLSKAEHVLNDAVRAYVDAVL